MRYFYPTIYFSFFLTQIISHTLNSQVSWKTGIETGYYNSSGEVLTAQENIQIKLDGFFKYVYDQNRQNASIQFRFRPEIVGIENRMRALRFKSFGSYYYDFDYFAGGINFTYQKHLFSTKNLKINYESFLIIGDLSFEIFTNSVLNTILGNAYYNLSVEEQSLDLIFLETKISQMINTNLQFGYGIYGEIFIVNSLTRVNYIIQKDKNSGWRFGPSINFAYTKNFIVNLDYRFLLHNSRLTTFPSFEHLVRVVTGKILTEKWSIFLLTNYYLRNFKTKDITLTENLLLYTPMNLENKVYLKFVYEMKPNTEIFLKGGYFKEYLYKNNLSFKGYNVMIGVEIGG